MSLFSDGTFFNDINMELKAIEKAIRDAVERYIDEEETYDDNAQLQIDPETMKVTVVDSEDAESDSAVAPDESESTGNEGVDVNPEVAGMDYVDVMDLIKMSTDNPGQWIPDDDAIRRLAEDYA